MDELRDVLTAQVLAALGKVCSVGYYLVRLSRCSPSRFSPAICMSTLLYITIKYILLYIIRSTCQFIALLVLRRVCARARACTCSQEAVTCRLDTCDGKQLSWLYGNCTVVSAEADESEGVDGMRMDVRVLMSQAEQRKHQKLFAGGRR